MKVSIFGAGYVGCVSAGCLVGDGFRVVIVDPDTQKIGIISSGKSPIYEPGLDEIIKKATSSGELKATSDYAQAVFDSDISLCCPGTPSRDA